MSKTTIPTGGITADAIDGTKIADDAINSEHYTDGSIDTAHIGDSQVTAAKATGVGGLAKIVEKTVNSAVSEVTFQNAFTSTYRKYLLVVSMLIPSSDATINLRFYQSDGTSEYSGGYYNFVSAGRDNSGNFESDQGNGDTKIVFCTGGTDANSASDGGMSGAFYFLEPYSSEFSARMTGTYQWRNASNEYVAQYIAGKYSGTALRTGFKLYPGSGNIEKCFATLYGVIN